MNYDLADHEWRDAIRAEAKERAERMAKLARRVDAFTRNVAALAREMRQSEELAA